MDSRRQRGQSAIEVLAVAPLLVAAAAVLGQAGAAAWAAAEAAGAATAAARAAAIGADPARAARAELPSALGQGLRVEVEAAARPSTSGSRASCRSTCRA